MRRFLLLLILLSIKCYSQNDLYDYIVTDKNDTIYGKYGRKFIDLNQEELKVKWKKIKVIKLDDRIYQRMTVKYKDFLSDGNDSLFTIGYGNPSRGFKKEGVLHLRLLEKELRKDYIITLENDTLYGNIEGFNSFRLFRKTKNKIKISSKLTKEFRKDGYKYFYKKGRLADFSARKHAYIKLILDGRVKLFEYTTKTSYDRQTSYETTFFIERNGKLHKVRPKKLWSTLSRVMPENKELLDKVRSRELKYRNLFIIIKYFNTMTDF